MLFYISCKICKQSLSIDYIASVYELFDNPSYDLLLKPSSWQKKESCPMLRTSKERYEQSFVKFQTYSDFLPLVSF